MFFLQNHMEFTNYAQMNTLCVTGRIVRSGVHAGPKGEFLSVQVASTMTNDGQTMKVSFTDNAGLLSLFKLGHLDKGRLVTLTGHMSQIKASYTNANGDEVLSDWPEVVLTGVQIPTGGLGPKPNADRTATKAGKVIVKRTVSKSDVEAPIDAAPMAY